MTGRNSIAATVPRGSAVDREVEAGVHRAEHRAHGDDHPPPVRVEPGERRQGRRHSAKMSAALAIRIQATPEGLDADEQQHGERRAEVVEDRAADEEALGRRVDR